MLTAQTPDIDAAPLHDSQLLTRSQRRSLAAVHGTSEYLHLINIEDNLPDAIYRRIDSLRMVMSEAHSATSGMDWRDHPELVYSLAYQDGAIDALGRMLTQFDTGDYTHIPHVSHVIRDYDRLLGVALGKHRYWDAAYIDGYRNAHMCLLLESEQLRLFPLYEIFDEQDFPPEVDDNSWQSSGNDDEDSDIEEDSSSSNENREAETDDTDSSESEQLPRPMSQDELLELFVGMKASYPKLFEEADRIISGLSEGYVPQHTAFLDGVTGHYSPPSIT